MLDRAADQEDWGHVQEDTDLVTLYKVHPFIRYSTGQAGKCTCALDALVIDM